MKEGTTKDIRSRAWMLTLPADLYDKEYVEEQLEGLSYIGQLERGSQSTEKNAVGYEHWQIFICNDNPIRFSSLRKKFPQGHYEAGERSQKGVSYVTKKETSLGVYVKGGDFETDTHIQGRRSDLRKLRNLILTEGKTAHEVLLTEERAIEYAPMLDRLQAERDEELASVWREDLKVYYLSGPTRSGKTRSVLKNADRKTYRVTDYSHPFDAYQNQGIVIFDEFRSQLGIDVMLDLMDIYPVQMSSRYHNRWALYNEVWIISNWPAERQFRGLPECDRAAFMARITAFYEMDGTTHTMKDITPQYRPSAADIEAFERSLNETENETEEDEIDVLPL